MSNTDKMARLREALRSAHNELHDELEKADNVAERNYIRGKRAGLLQAIAELSHIKDEQGQEESSKSRGIELRTPSPPEISGVDVGGDEDE